MTEPGRPARTAPAFPPVHGWPASVAWEGVSLEPFRRRDVAAWADVRARNARWLGRWDATAPPEADSQPLSHGAIARRYAREARAGRSIPWLIWVDVAGQRGRSLAGQISVSNITYGAARFCTLGYWIDERWAGRGLMPTAVALASDYCFQAVRLHRVEVNIRPENGPSLRVVEKLGFRHEGTRPAYLHIEGDWRDHEMYALHADEVGDGLWMRLPDDVPRVG